MKTSTQQDSFGQKLPTHNFGSSLGNTSIQRDSLDCHPSPTLHGSLDHSEKLLAVLRDTVTRATEVLDPVLRQAQFDAGTGCSVEETKRPHVPPIIGRIDYLNAGTQIELQRLTNLLERLAL